ncbi:DUF4249 domain-containing protein [Spirosoma utsteinense]|uniref:DUF4249 domain-containing protein n=1 Tax=Spirosoma utsteinense TaxID=2585773 RepID=A0ABR6WF04_9BACT|nr:DUF4249 domain-containing protein [Spirosoma utsteinense]MBC3785685.1 hypothetical protein [Spirosoma utsteinense]MBC3795136.1 hypothetical protein [Spirosoma utsteinense]
MRALILLLVVCGSLTILPLGCVDPLELSGRGTVDVIVIDGTITNLAEDQTVRINRSKADPLTGRFGSTPITQATVTVVVDSVQIIRMIETDSGKYRAPAKFMGQIGHTYQLHITLRDGTRYESSTEVMQAVPPIGKLSSRFNPNSLAPDQQLQNFYAAAHDFYVTIKDPANQHNYYRWGWKLWEKQQWCRTCANGAYFIHDPRDTTMLYENCFPVSTDKPYVYDYECRTHCWDIFQGYEVNVFDDQYSNGGTITDRRVAQIPLYQRNPCLVEIRQGSLTADAHRYFKLLQDQTQNTGGIADTPPTIAGGNVRNLTNTREPVVGYFSASAVSSELYWLDRKDATTRAPGLFMAKNDRDPIPESLIFGPIPLLIPGESRPPTAVCLKSDGRTPTTPKGWREN